MSDEIPAFYAPRADGAFDSAPWTRGPWDVRMQHGGPPSALMARAVDVALGEERDAWIPARTMIELRKPVPIARLEVAASIETRGRQAIRARAALVHEGVEIAFLRAILLRAVEPAPALARGEPESALPTPDACASFSFPFFLDPVGYHAAMDIRLADPWPGPRCRAWSRMRGPLVEGESPGGWQRALCFADAAHGVAPALDPMRFTIVNPDLELSLVRRPRGEWVALDVRTTTTEIGTGLTRSRVVDGDGDAGAASATLVVRPRG